MGDPRVCVRDVSRAVARGMPAEHSPWAPGAEGPPGTREGAPLGLLGSPGSQEVFTGDVCSRQGPFGGK